MTNRCEVEKSEAGVLRAVRSCIQPRSVNSCGDTDFKLYFAFVSANIGVVMDEELMHRQKVVFHTTLPKIAPRSKLSSRKEMSLMKLSEEIKM